MPATHRGETMKIQRVRLDKAKDLLARTDLPILTVARRSGFAHASHLSAVFRREEGLTPSDYRDRIRVKV